ncbi:MAG: hypothetical protein DLM65_03965, partial [Candidatus Aeolococcus gillhamiae]
GYPLGLSTIDIPLGARIVSVVDAFDVMTEGRPYAKSKPVEAAVAELIRQRGRQFDPDAVDAFVTTLGGTGDYHDVVDTVSELDLIARRAAVPSQARSMVGEAVR